jgi:hypothetical protein
MTSLLRAMRTKHEVFVSRVITRLMKGDAETKRAVIGIELSVSDKQSTSFGVDVYSLDGELSRSLCLCHRDHLTRGEDHPTDSL